MFQKCVKNCKNDPLRIMTAVQEGTACDSLFLAQYTVFSPA
ncbi:hypothetical protein MNB_SV-10-767 [hydrothermal vent metagenome]|uniref:Uncharacterized protein n=1 Tax=hydrothermal vent metagenome TaxID=652676 RepID=A0A1W1BP56_9ZZZZ